MIFGIDFDNTVVGYDALMCSIAQEWDLLASPEGMTKKHIRDAVRALPDGEILWQRIQIAAYGTRMSEAAPCEGVKDFLRLCGQLRVPVYIVSHKTVRPNLPGANVDLRRAAMDWLDRQGFLDPDFGISRERVFFESSRSDKVARIRKLGITHFVDDLEETFQDPGFPSGVAKILYSSGQESSPAFVTLPSWSAIADYLLPASVRFAPGPAA